MANAAARRRGLGQHVQQVRPDQPVRRLQGVGLRPRGRPPRPGGLPAGRVDDRVDVRKTYKLYIGGAFPRSESGHSYVVNDAKGRFVANAALASRKDARDAVVGGPQGVRRAGPARTAYNRGQVVYRVAEVMEDRRAAVRRGAAPGRGRHAAAAAQGCVDAAIDRLVWYAGWADKIAQVVGNANPVAGPFFNLSTPEPTGVVAVLAPAGVRLLGLVSVVAPVIVTGNTVRGRRVAPTARCRRSRFAEVLATSDVPGGVVNILTGSLAEHRAVRWPRTWTSTRIDLTGLAGDAELADGARGRGRREPQAGTPRAGRRARLDRRPGPRPDDRRSWRPRPSGTRSASEPERRSVTAWTSPAPAGR